MRQTRLPLEGTKASETGLSQQSERTWATRKQASAKKPHYFCCCGVCICTLCQLSESKKKHKTNLLILGGKDGIKHRDLLKDVTSFPVTQSGKCRLPSHICLKIHPFPSVPVQSPLLKAPPPAPLPSAFLARNLSQGVLTLAAVAFHHWLVGCGPTPSPGQRACHLSAAWWNCP